MKITSGGSGLTVVTVLREGDFRRREYNVEWVERLQRRARILLPEARFICLSNNPRVPGYVPLRHNWPGWWSKIELFRDDLPTENRCIYFDLDSLLVAGLSELGSWNSDRLCLCPNYHDVVGGSPAGGPGVVDGFATPVIAFNPGDYHSLYVGFSQNVGNNIKQFRGDQDYISHRLLESGLGERVSKFPKEWFLKLRDCQKGPPEGIKVIHSMPWKNNRAVKRFPWTKEYWPDA